MKIIKVYNANKAAGGTGNISQFHNDEAHSFKKEIDNKFNDYIKDNNIDVRAIPHGEIEKMENDFKAYIDKEHAGFVGHNQKERDQVFDYMKKMVDPYIKKEGKGEDPEAKFKGKTSSAKEATVKETHRYSDFEGRRGHMHPLAVGREYIKKIQGALDFGRTFDQNTMDDFERIKKRAAANA